MGNVDSRPDFGPSIAGVIERPFPHRRKVTLYVSVLIHSGYEDQLFQGREVLSALQRIAESSSSYVTGIKRTSDSLVCDCMVNGEDHSLVFNFLDDPRDRRSRFILERSYGIVYFVETLTDRNFRNILDELRRFEENEQVENVTSLIVAKEVAISRRRAAEESIYFMEFYGQCEVKSHPFRKFVCSMSQLQRRGHGSFGGINEAIASASEHVLGSLFNR